MIEAPPELLAAVALSAARRLAVEKPNKFQESAIKWLRKLLAEAEHDVHLIETSTKNTP